MGRLKYLNGASHFSVKYRKLLDRDYLQILPNFPEYMSYSCCHCGHIQKLKAKQAAGKSRHKDPLLRQSEDDLNVLSSSPQYKKQHVEANVVINSAPHILNNAVVSRRAPIRTQKNSPMSPIKPSKPTSIPGLSHRVSSSVTLPSSSTKENNNIDQLTPCSEESNSPTDLNSYKRLVDKPPLIKRFTMGFNDDDLCPLVSTSTARGRDTGRSSGGYVNEAVHETESTMTIAKKEVRTPPMTVDNKALEAKDIEFDTKRISISTSPEDYKSKRISQISCNSSNNSNSLVPISTDGSIPTTAIPSLPDRQETYYYTKTEENDLKTAPWFQAGIPREIALEVLGQEPVGAFMVRESTSKPGCFALSLRVPMDFQPSGIAHYLIMRTNKGYKIKGFTKEFTTLVSLITHHSVMPELLPCPLSLSRYNPNFANTDTSCDFADIDSDPDYNTLADFRKMMADLNV